MDAKKIQEFPFSLSYSIGRIGAMEAFSDPEYWWWLGAENLGGNSHGNN